MMGEQSGKKSAETIDRISREKGGCRKTDGEEDKIKRKKRSRGTSHSPRCVCFSLVRDCVRVCACVFV